jgi:hypothetical protein
MNFDDIKAACSAILSLGAVVSVAILILFGHHFADYSGLDDEWAEVKIDRGEDLIKIMVNTNPPTTLNIRPNGKDCTNCQRIGDPCFGPGCNSAYEGMTTAPASVLNLTWDEASNMTDDEIVDLYRECNYKWYDRYRDAYLARKEAAEKAEAEARKTTYPVDPIGRFLKRMGWE